MQIMEVIKQKISSYSSNFFPIKYLVLLDAHLPKVQLPGAVVIHAQSLGEGLDDNTLADSVIAMSNNFSELVIITADTDFSKRKLLYKIKSHSHLHVIDLNKISKPDRRRYGARKRPIAQVTAKVKRTTIKNAYNKWKQSLGA